MNSENSEVIAIHQLSDIHPIFRKETDVMIKVHVSIESVVRAMLLDACAGRLGDTYGIRCIRGFEEDDEVWQIKIVGVFE